MPLKTCPECSAQHGPRKKVCDCGHKFVHPLVPEPGGWVLDNIKGLPVMDPPDIDWPSGKLDNEFVRDTVSYEGLGFCIYSLIPAGKIKDAPLRKLWKEARDKMQKITEYLYDD